MQVDAGISVVSVVTFARGGGAAPPRTRVRRRRFGLRSPEAF